MPAFKIELDIQGAAELAKLWEAAPDITREELLRATTEADLLLKREVQERTPVVTGTLRKSITSYERALADKVIGVVGSPLNYAIPVELGRGKAKGAHMFRKAFTTNRDQVTQIFEGARDRVVQRLTESHA